MVHSSLSCTLAGADGRTQGARLGTSGVRINISGALGPWGEEVPLVMK